MIIRAMRLAKQWMMHQPYDSRAEIVILITTHFALRHHVVHGLAEVERPLAWRRLLREVVPVHDDLGPVVAVEVVHGATGADQEDILITEVAEKRADVGVQGGVVLGVKGNECCGWTAFGEHPFEGDDGVVDPI